ncbi:two-component system regulatory protein YycI [Oceanobacillus sojae]|uniref:two-component system regulatory protein YycI n=1 Tax=Oceanobacillus sojae TaxID=582851 RepID=UPI000988803A|nr:two-component system regulatory protein YycI [Oceanobacillus sojae]
MRWSHIKTLFILSFLILNGYLLYQFISNQDEMNIPELDTSSMDLDEELRDEDISISADVDFEVPELSYISSAQKKFTESEISDLNDNKHINAEKSPDSQLLIAAFSSPLKIPDNADEETLSSLVSPYILDSSDFSFGAWDDDLNIIVFFQNKEGNPIYLNRHAMLTFYVNDNNEITHYTQTMLGDTDPQGNPTLNTPKIAISSLLQSRYLNAEDNITDVSYGYYSRIAEAEEGTQVFAPTYKITVNGESDYFVNAAESTTYSGNYRDYLVKMLAGNYLRKLNLMADEDDSMADSLISVIEDKIEPFRSDLE